jgi:hypothetical protein
VPLLDSYNDTSTSTVFLVHCPCCKMSGPRLHDIGEAISVWNKAMAK